MQQHTKLPMTDSWATSAAMTTQHTSHCVSIPAHRLATLMADDCKVPSLLTAVAAGVVSLCSGFVVCISVHHIAASLAKRLAASLAWVSPTPHIFPHCRVVIHLKVLWLAQDQKSGAECSWVRQQPVFCSLNTLMLGKASRVSSTTMQQATAPEVAPLVVLHPLYLPSRHRNSSTRRQS